MTQNHGEAPRPSRPEIGQNCPFSKKNMKKNDFLVPFCKILYSFLE